jgi:carboxylesterase type B
VLTTAQAAQVSEQLTARLGVAATRDAVAAVPVDQLVAPSRRAHPSAAVAETMHSTWVRFAASGDPGWPPGTTARLADKLTIVR